MGVPFQLVVGQATPKQDGTCGGGCGIGLHGDLVQQVYGLVIFEGFYARGSLQDHVLMGTQVKLLGCEGRMCEGGRCEGGWFEGRMCEGGRCEGGRYLLCDI